ncbi:MAG TPA: hypothetical protein DCM28_15035 [Phycisphaerales bacterium]|nr:hypothetical protein [Phycisphaerales bacterium]
MEGRIADHSNYARQLKLILKKSLSRIAIVIKKLVLITKCMAMTTVWALAGCQSAPNSVTKLPTTRHLVFTSNRAVPHEEFDLFAVRLDTSENQKAQIIQLTDTPGHELDPTVTQDGQHLLYIARPVIPNADTAAQLTGRGQSSLIYMDLRTGQRSILYRSEGVLTHPSWSNDGKRIAFSLMQTGSGEIVEHRVKCLILASRHVHDLGSGAYPNWLGDNRHLVISEIDATGNSQLWRVDAQTGKRTQMSRPGPSMATLSPDRRYLAVAVPEGRDGRPTITV